MRALPAGVLPRRLARSALRVRTEKTGWHPPTHSLKGVRRGSEDGADGVGEGA